MSDLPQYTHCQPASPDDPDALKIGFAPLDPFLAAVLHRRAYWHWWLGQEMQRFVCEYLEKVAPSTEEERRARMATDSDKPNVDCASGTSQTIYQWNWCEFNGETIPQPDGTWQLVGYEEAVRAAGIEIWQRGFVPPPSVEPKTIRFREFL